VATATVKAASGTTTPSGPVSFTLGTNSLGTATLSGSGGTATASITVFGGQLLAANNTVQAFYGGSPTFGSSSAAASISSGRPATSLVTVSVTPNPVYQQAPDANGRHVQFHNSTERDRRGGHDADRLHFDGVSFAGSIAGFFGSINAAGARHPPQI
jgi:hypothetical protein